MTRAEEGPVSVARPPTSGAPEEGSDLAEHDLRRRRARPSQAGAEAAARTRRLIAARRWARRAELATRRAARASDAVR